jgi:hypothetical protein
VVLYCTDKALSVFAMKEYKESKVLTALILTFGAIDEGEWSTSCSSCFTPGTELWYPLNRRLGGPQSQSEHSGEDKNFLPCWDYHSLIKPKLNFQDKFWCTTSSLSHHEYSFCSFRHEASGKYSLMFFC